IADGKLTGEAARNRHNELLDRLVASTRELAELNAKMRDNGELRAPVKQYEADGEVLSLNVGTQQGIFGGQSLELSFTKSGGGFWVNVRVLQASPNRCIVRPMNGAGQLALSAGDAVRLSRAG